MRDVFFTILFLVVLGSAVVWVTGFTINAADDLTDENLHGTITHKLAEPNVRYILDGGKISYYRIPDPESPEKFCGVWTDRSTPIICNLD